MKAVSSRSGESLGLARATSFAPRTWGISKNPIKDQGNPKMLGKSADLENWVNLGNPILSPQTPTPVG